MWCSRRPIGAIFEFNTTTHSRSFAFICKVFAKCQPKMRRYRWYVLCKQSITCNLSFSFSSLHEISALVEPAALMQVNRVTLITQPTRLSSMNSHDPRHQPFEVQWQPWTLNRKSSQRLRTLHDSAMLQNLIQDARYIYCFAPNVLLCSARFPSSIISLSWSSLRARIYQSLVVFRHNQYCFMPARHLPPMCSSCVPPSLRELRIKVSLLRVGNAIDKSKNSAITITNNF